MTTPLSAQKTTPLTTDGSGEQPTNLQNFALAELNLVSRLKRGGRIVGIKSEPVDGMAILIPAMSG